MTTGTKAVRQAPSPLYDAEHAPRYDRQRVIQAYQEEFGCRLIAIVDVLHSASVTYVEELIYDADPSKPMHVLLSSPGGDGETAVRLARSIHSRCSELTVIIPDQAKSAATLFAMGAHRILMGPTSDLGPVDPQLLLPTGAWSSAKDIIAAVDDAEARVQASPQTYPVYASLLAGLSALTLAEARSALARTDDLVREALLCNDMIDNDRRIEIMSRIKELLVDTPRSHAAVVGSRDAESMGLPVERADPAGHQWQTIWRLWAKYFSLGRRVYEGDRACRELNW